MTKTLFQYVLMGVLATGLGMSVTSCKDDVDGTPSKAETTDDDRSSDEAATFLVAMEQLCDVDELPENWRTATYSPTIGVVVDESNPTVRTVYVDSRDEATLKFLSMIPADVNPDDADMTMWSHGVLGTLDFNYVYDGANGLLATVDVQSPRIPQLSQIRYVDNEAMPDNSNYFNGPAYYQLGDVVEEKTSGGNSVYWICVRPAHPSLKEESHWVSLSYDERCVKEYSSLKYNKSYIPTNLKQSDEHLTNFCQLLYFMKNNDSFKAKMHSDPSLENGLGGLNGLYDNEYLATLNNDWQELGIWNRMPEKLRQKLDDLTKGYTDTLSFYVSGYTSLSSNLKVYKSIANKQDNFANVTNTSDEFRPKVVDLRPAWQNGKILTMQYRKATDLMKGYKGNMQFDPGRFTTVYRYTEHHTDLGMGQPVEGHYGSFLYNTVSATGQPIVLSAMMGWPKSNVARDIIAGCHVTVTNNPDAPSMWAGKTTRETNLLLDHLHDKDKAGYNCLVILPDYEGYGTTVGVPHPYLCQEVTARQVADAVVAGKELFLKRGGILEQGFKTISVGYSQGGSVAMATQRYMEEHPDIMSELNYSGAICADGPYDPMATFNEYFTSKRLHMPVVMPLVLTSYCTYDPDMKAAECRIEDFLTPQFLESGIVDQVKEKKLHTKEIQARLKSFVKSYNKRHANSPDAERFHPGEDTHWYILTSDVVKDDCIRYFTNPDNYEGPNAAKYEALYKALLRNQAWGRWNKTNNWKNKTKLALFHSTRDEVVPYVNYTLAVERLDNYHGWNYSAKTVYGHIMTGAFFYVWYEIDLVKKVLESDVLDNGQETVGGLIF